MNRQQILRFLTLSGLLLVSLVLAFALQDVVRAAIITPLAYLWWALGVFYSTLPQVILWIVLIILVVVMLIKSLLGQHRRVSFVKGKVKPQRGNIETLASELEKTRSGTYHKWKVANRLAKLARDMLIQRGDRENTKYVGPLTGRDWHPSEPVGEYLEVGLNGSFADYPNPRWPFEQPQPTPLDLDARKAVKFLETQMKPQPQINADEQ